MIELPWYIRSRQQEGLRTEKEVAKERDMRVHPRSGAGDIKWDASDDDTILEVKDAYHTHTLNSQKLNSLYVRAVRQGKEPLYVVRFANNIEAEIKLRRYQ